MVFTSAGKAGHYMTLTAGLEGLLHPTWDAANHETAVED
jgi:hypothetical protein